MSHRLAASSVEGAANGHSGPTFCEPDQWAYRHANFGRTRASDPVVMIASRENPPDKLDNRVIVSGRRACSGSFVH